MDYRSANQQVESRRWSALGFAVIAFAFVLMGVTTAKHLSQPLFHSRSLSTSTQSPTLLKTNRVCILL